MAQAKGCIPVNKSNTNTFTQKAVIKHANFYDYTKVNYINSKTPVIITCPIHGDFKQTPGMHLQGQGCVRCSTKRRIQASIMTETEFISKAIIKHGSKFLYPEWLNKNQRHKIKIFCTSCNQFFWQLPTDHLQGHGCSHCTPSTVDYSKPVIFYVISLPNGLFKFGITGRSVKHRYKNDNYKKLSIVSILETSFIKGYDALLFEYRIKQVLAPYTYNGPALFTKTKNTEIVTIDPINIIQQEFKTCQYLLRT